MLRCTFERSYARDTVKGKRCSRPQARGTG